MNTDNREIEIYVHIPFCVRKCAYCDFLSAPADEESRFVYMKALEKEIENRANRLKRALSDGEQKITVKTIFVGGGTPTVLDGNALVKLLKCIRMNFDVDKDAEITFECNPGTTDYEKLKMCRDAGYNRISIGLQSALDDELKVIGRIHGWNDFLNTYRLAVECGFDNINVDLMTALPGQTTDNVDKSINRVLALKPRPTHISAYSLILEENTEFWNKYLEGNLELPDEDTEREMHWRLIDRLEAEGYREYELSNLSLPGCECKHNVGYWTRKEYAGFGIGAASLIGNSRYANTRDINEYVRYWMGEIKDCTEAVDNAPLSEETELSREDIIEEYMFLGLRLTEGISVADFCEKFDENINEIYGDIIQKNISDGLLEMLNNHLRLTRRGQDLANYVFAQFILG